MKRRWRVVLLRAKGEILGTVEAPDVEAAKAAAAVQFDLEGEPANRMAVGYSGKWYERFGNSSIGSICKNLRNHDAADARCSHCQRLPSPIGV